MDLLGTVFLSRDRIARAVDSRAASRLPIAPKAHTPSLTWAFSGSLYVDMISEEVPVRWSSFSSAMS